MKSAWKKQVKLWQIEHIGESLTKKDFPKVFKATWESVTSVEIAVRGFRRCGLFPLDASGIDKTKLKPSSVANPPTPTGKELAAMPEEHQQLAESTVVAQCSKASTLHDSENSHDETAPQNVQDHESTAPLVVQPLVLDVSTSVTQKTGEMVFGASQERAFSVASTSKDGSYVSPAFQMLQVPEPKVRKRCQTITQKLPKALTGTIALKMFEEREKQKAAEMLRKQKRKEEMEQKRKEKEELIRKRKLEREEKKKLKDLEKILMQKKKQRKESSSSDEENGNVVYMDSDGSFDETEICPGCKTNDAINDPDEWVTCQKCKRSWHVSCTGEAILVEIPIEQLKAYPFHCEACI